MEFIPTANLQRLFSLMQNYLVEEKCLVLAQEVFFCNLFLIQTDV